MSEPRRQTGPAIWTALAVSMACHLAVGASLIPALRPESDAEQSKPNEEAESEEPEQMRVQVVPDPDEPEPKQRRKRARKEKKQKKKPEKRRKKEKKKNPQKKIQKNYNRKAVVQETNEESPEEAEFVSKNANKTKKETRARETSKEFVKPSNNSSQKKRETQENEESPEEKLGSKAVASKARRRPKPRRRRRERQQRREQRERQEESEKRPIEKTPEKEGPKPAPKQKQEATEQTERPQKPLPMPRLSDYDKVFDEEADRRRRKRHAEKGVGHDMYRRIEKSKGSVKAAMENYIPEVQPGNHTSVNAHASKAAAYVNRIHSKIHPRWGGRFLPHLDTTYGPTHPLSNPNLNTVLEFVIDGETGELAKVTIVSSSGVTSYDMEAVLISQHVAPHSKPPKEIVSPDGNVYMHWNFWRDQRQCGTFGVDVYKMNPEK